MLSDIELDNAALKKLNELFEESNRAAKIGVWELDITTNTLFWSSTTKVIHGVDPNYNPTVEEAFKFIKPGTNLELLKTYVDKAITNNIPYDIEMQIIKKDGTEIWTRARGTPEFRNGKCSRLFGTFQDIQEQKDKEIELIDSELKMSAIFNNNIDALFLTSPIDGSILRANKAASNLFGYTEFEFNQLGRKGIIDISDHKLPDLLEKRKNESHITTDLIGIKKNGDRFPIRVSSGIFTDAQGNTQASTCIIDITEIIHYQKQIEDSARKFKGIFNSTFQFIGFLTPDGTLTEANNTAIQFAGLKPEDVIGKKIWDCHWWSISDKTREELRLNIEKAAKGEFVQYEVEILGANNSTTTILFNLKSLFN
ncbi:MAG: PAS domain S-box protein [Sediminibacterium sp.]